jgi:hypothetical protein
MRWTLMAVFLVGCGGTDEECVAPGMYVCQYTYTGGDCEVGTVKDTWQVQMGVAQEFCGQRVETATYQEGGCEFSCTSDLSAAPISTVDQIKGTGGCNRVCPNEQCLYTASVVCKR